MTIGLVTERRSGAQGWSAGAHLALAAVSVAITLAFGSPASAATFLRCTTAAGNAPTQSSTVGGAILWRTVPTFRINSTDFPTGSVLRTGITWARAEWNRNPQNLTLQQTFVATTAERFTDRVSDIYLNPSTCGAACTIVFQSCAEGIIAADIEFMPTTSVNWGSGNGVPYFPYVTGGPADARAAALHEFGHAIGMGHTNNTYSLMGDGWRSVHMNSGTELGLFNYPYVGADTTVAVRTLYGNRAGTRPELSVSHWAFWKTAGAISNHRFARVYPRGSGVPVPVRGAFSAGCPLQPTNASPTACAYDVSRGQLVDVEFTHENTGGVAASSVSVVFKLSTDVTIDQNDTTLATERINYPLGVPDLRRHPITIPGNLIRGRFYYLGVILDPSNAVQEIQEDTSGNAAPPAWTGNAAFIPIFIL